MLSVGISIDFFTFEIAHIQLRLALFEDFCGVFHAISLGTNMAQNQEGFSVS